MDSDDSESHYESNSRYYLRMVGARAHFRCLARPANATHSENRQFIGIAIILFQGIASSPQNRRDAFRSPAGSAGVKGRTWSCPPGAALRQRPSFWPDPGGLPPRDSGKPAAFVRECFWVYLILLMSNFGATPNFPGNCSNVPCFDPEDLPCGHITCPAHA